MAVRDNLNSGDNRIYLLKDGKYPHPEISSKLVYVQDDRYNVGSMVYDSAKKCFTMTLPTGSYYTLAYLKDTHTVNIGEYSKFCCKIKGYGGGYNIYPRISYMSKVTKPNTEYTDDYISCGKTKLGSYFSETMENPDFETLELPLFRSSKKIGGLLGIKVNAVNKVEVYEMWLEK